jgi:hypothetical protein
MVRGMQPTEREFQTVVIQAAEAHGWTWWHFADSRRQVGSRLVGDAGAAGFPDLTLAHSRWGLVMAELKSRSGKLRPAQQRSLDALGSAVATAAPRGVLVHVWRPDDWDTVVLPVLAGTYDGERFYGW